MPGRPSLPSRLRAAAEALRRPAAPRRCRAPTESRAPRPPIAGLNSSSPTRRRLAPPPSVPEPDCSRSSAAANPDCRSPEDPAAPPAQQSARATPTATSSDWSQTTRQRSRASCRQPSSLSTSAGSRYRCSCGPAKSSRPSRSSARSTRPLPAPRSASRRSRRRRRCSNHSIRPASRTRRPPR